MLLQHETVNTDDASLVAQQDHDNPKDSFLIIKDPEVKSRL